MSIVIDLAQTASTPALSDVGGKGRNLAVLLAAGFPVPPAWCVTTTAYRAVTAGLLDEVLDHLARTPAQDRDRLAALAEQARRLIESAELPAELEQEIVDVLPSAGPVAVRSSATAEDLPDASFAGQQDSFLQVVGTAAVLRAVRACWASLWSDRAVAYRADQGIDPRSVALAVVVQSMVAAEVAGVLFTADPVTGTRDRCVIDASPGLGEAVVSGAVDPDRFVVDTATGTVVERRLGRRTLAVRPRPGGGTDRVDLLTSGDGERPGEGGPCLGDDAVRALARLGKAVEDLYGAPQDLEWALDGAGDLWLLQARPITTLYPLVHRPDRSGLRVFLCVSLAQGLTRPLTPLGLSAVRLIGSCLAGVVGRALSDPNAGPGALRVAGGRPFVDVTAALRHPLGRHFLLAAMGVMEARAAAVLRDLIRREDFRLQHRGQLAVAVPVLRLVHLTRAPVRVVSALVDPASARRAARRIEGDIRRRLSLPADAEPRQHLALVVDHLGSRSFLVMPAMLPYAGAGFLALALARRLLRDDLAPGELQQVLRGLPHNPTTEMDLALWAVTEQVRADPASRRRLVEATDDQLSADYLAGTTPEVLTTQLAEFLRRYGHRTVAEIDLGMPRWRDDPAPLFGALRNYLLLPDGALSPAAQFAATAQEAGAVRARLVARARRRGRVRGWLVDRALHRAYELAGLREMPKFLLIVTLAELRRHLMAVAEHLVQRGLLGRAEDVAFCELDALRRGLAGQDLQPEVEAARQAYDRELRRRHVPRLLLSDGTEPEALLPAPVGALTGTPASAGVVTGRARVVLDPRGAHLEPGEVLVAPSTDPGWTPLFLTAGALVMEMGGANSHGAVVAREYGIPAVVGVTAATTRLDTGDLVTVDGGAGTIVVAPSAGSPPDGRAAALSG